MADTEHDPDAATAQDDNQGDHPGETAADIALGPLAQQLGYVIRRAQIRVFQEFHRTFAPFDIRPAQYSVLSVLRHSPGLRQSQVAEALGIKRTNFVALFDTLEQRGLARRDRVPDDRRAFALHLTQAGEALTRELDTLALAHDARFAARLGETGKRQLLDLLQLLLQA